MISVALKSILSQTPAAGLLLLEPNSAGNLQVFFHCESGFYFESVLLVIGGRDAAVSAAALDGHWRFFVAFMIAGSLF